MIGGPFGKGIENDFCCGAPNFCGIAGNDGFEMCRRLDVRRWVEDDDAGSGVFESGERRDGSGKIGGLEQKNGGRC